MIYLNIIHKYGENVNKINYFKWLLHNKVFVNNNVMLVTFKMNEEYVINVNTDVNHVLHMKIAKVAYKIINSTIIYVFIKKTFFVDKKTQIVDTVICLIWNVMNVLISFIFTNQVCVLKNALKTLFAHNVILLIKISVYLAYKDLLYFKINVSEIVWSGTIIPFYVPQILL